MNKLFGLFLLALACWAPGVADAASRFAVCTTTCTWDNTSTAMWSTSTGGATGASAPVAGDDVTIDAATCVGGTTCTITTFAGTISAATVTWGACTASTTGCIIEAGTNNTNFTLANTIGPSAFNGSGTGTRKWNAGTGTYTLTSTNSNAPINMQTVTNDTSVFSAAAWVVGGTYGAGTAHSLQLGGKSYGSFTLSGNSSRGPKTIVGTNTFASMTIGAPNFINFANSVTQTISGALTITGSSSSNPVSLTSNFTETAATLSLGAASSGDWVTLRAITTSGAAAFTGTNCLNLGLNTLANAGTCTAPSGGGGGSRIIGG